MEKNITNLNLELDMNVELDKIDNQLQDLNFFKHKASLTNICFSELEKKKYLIELYLDENDAVIRKKMEILFNESYNKKTCYLLLGLDVNGGWVGLNENQYYQTLKNLDILCQEFQAKYVILNESIGNNGKILEIKMEKFDVKNEIRIGVFGEGSSGKSTLIGVLVNGILDDGNGLARSNIFRFQHELDSGKTSNVSQYIIGFDNKGNLINCDSNSIKINGETQDNKSRLMWEEVAGKSNKILTFFDVGGSSKVSVNFYFSLVYSQKNI